MTTVEFLLLNGAKVDIRDNNGQGPLHHATQLSHTGYFIFSYGLIISKIPSTILEFSSTNTVV